MENALLPEEFVTPIKGLLAFALALCAVSWLVTSPRYPSQVRIQPAGKGRCRSRSKSA
jgi:hypothetical protein